MNMIEEVKNYWNRRACNIRRSPKPVGTVNTLMRLEIGNTLESRIFPGLHNLRGRRTKKCFKLIVALVLIR